MIYDVEFRENVEEPRARTFHHTAIVKHNEMPLTIKTLQAAASALATNPQVPPWATVQVSYPNIYVYWQTTDAGNLGG